MKSTPPPLELPPYAVYCDKLRNGLRSPGHVERVYDFEVAVRIAKEQRGFAIRNEPWATDELNEFGGLTTWQVDQLFAQGWPWTGVSEVAL